MQQLETVPIFELGPLCFPNENLMATPTVEWRKMKVVLLKPDWALPWRI